MIPDSYLSGAKRLLASELLQVFLEIDWSNISIVIVDLFFTKLRKYNRFVKKADLFFIVKVYRNGHNLTWS